MFCLLTQHILSYSLRRPHRARHADDVSPIYMFVKYSWHTCQAREKMTGPCHLLGLPGQSWGLTGNTRL